MPVWFPNDESPEIDDGEEPIPSLSGTYHPSPNDVLQVRRMLLNIIPIEIVEPILYKAKYWCRLLAHTKKPHVLNDYSSSSRWLYFVCPPLPPPPLFENGESARVKYAMVAFWTRSRDQGLPIDWPDPDDEEYDTWEPQYSYVDSFTWFEACIYRRPPIDIPDQMITPLISDCVPFTENEDFQPVGKWHLQSNLNGKYAVTMHNVIWTDDGEQRKDEDGIIKETGAGKGIEFVKSLQEGDRIAVVSAKNPKYSEIANRVREVAVEVYYTIY